MATDTWVATRNGKCRHLASPLHRSINDRGECPKVLVCQETPLVVHECTQEEMEILQVCINCEVGVGLDEAMADLAQFEELLGF